MTADRSQTIQIAIRMALQSLGTDSKVALRTATSEISYANLSSCAFQFEAACHRRGWNDGVRVGLVLDKSIRTVSFLLGLLLAGACPAFIDPRTATDDLQQRVKAAKLKALVCEPKKFREVGGAVSASVCFEDIKPEASETDRRPNMAISDPAMLLFTSGSTGKPKGALLSQGALAVHAAGVIERTGLTSRDELLHIMPLFHTNGVNNQLVAPILCGATIELRDKFDPEAVVNLLRRGDHTIITGVPTMLIRMLPFIAENERFGTLRMIRCGSAPIKESQVQDIENAFGVPVILSYGMSEATCTTAMNPPDKPRVGSVGIALQGQSIRVSTPGSVEPLGPGREGEVLIGGGAIMSAYVGDNGPSPIESGWLRTGDLGMLDGEGYLTITGRLKDTIVRGGENISPATIEQAIARHPSVRDCSVVGLEHHDLGEVPIAYVTLNHSSTQDIASEVFAALEESLTRNLHPAAIRVLPYLPVNGVGKIDRKKLERMAAASF